MCGRLLDADQWPSSETIAIGAGMAITSSVEIVGRLDIGIQAKKCPAAIAAPDATSVGNSAIRSAWTTTETRLMVNLLNIANSRASSRKCEVDCFLTLAPNEGQQKRRRSH